MDFLYSGISFGSESFRKFQSEKDGDGGLAPGKLVFASEFEKFSGIGTEALLQELTGKKPPDSLNVGGPCIVALIHAAQMLEGKNVDVSFYGLSGNDSTSDQLFRMIAQTPLNSRYYQRTNGITPYTVVLSDPSYHHGKGERAFINHIGAAWEFTPDGIDPSFFDAGITVFGGTALVPAIHDSLHDLLQKARNHGSPTVVNTVYDFRNEKKSPGTAWPLGDSAKSFPLIDLLIADREEALKITGQFTIESAFESLKTSGAGAFIITDGDNPVSLFSRGTRFQPLLPARLPVSETVTLNSEGRSKGDTTGCGDNFAGGVLFSLASQYLSGKITPDLMEAAHWGIVSGGFACYYLGGNYTENEPGEKYRKVKNLYTAYLEQTGN